MIEYTNKPVTYDALKSLLNSDQKILSPETRTLLVIAIALIVIIAITISLIVEHISGSMLFAVIVALIIMISGFTITLIYSKHFDITYELEHHHPKYRDINITSHIDDISNGSIQDTQELRFAYNNKNYYITIPSDVPVSTNNKINIKIKNQMVDDIRDKHNLNEALNKPDGQITIQHRDKTYKTHIKY